MDLNTISAVAHPRSREQLPVWAAGDAWLAGGTWLFSEPQAHLRRLVDLTDLKWPALTIGDAALTIAATCTIAQLDALPCPPDWLAACVAALDEWPGAGVAYTDQQDFGASDRYHSVAEYDFRGQSHKNWFGICSLFRRAAWEAVGGWDAEIALTEDWDF